MKTTIFSTRTVFLFCSLALGQHFCLADRFPAPFQTLEQRKQWGERNRAFGRLWLSRHQNPKKTALAILPFALEKVDLTADLRIRAVVALGRIEEPVAEKPLLQLLTQTQKALGEEQKQHEAQLSWVNRLSPWRLKFAIARIRSRRLKGEKRLNFVALALGTTWPGMRKLGLDWRKKVHTTRDGSYGFLDSDARPLIEEFAQLLNSMGKRGEDVKAFGASDLMVWDTGSKLPDALYSPEQAPIIAARLSRKAEIDFWLQRATPPGFNALSPQQFLDLGPQARPALHVALEKLLPQVQRNPAMMNGVQRVGYISMMRAVGASGDLTFVPTLQKFKAVKQKWTRIYASQAIENLQSGEGAWILPVQLNKPI